MHFASRENNNNYVKYMQLEHNQAELIRYLEHSQHGAPKVIFRLVLIEAITEM